MQFLNIFINLTSFYNDSCFNEFCPLVFLYVSFTTIALKKFKNKLLDVNIPFQTYKRTYMP